MKVKLSTTFEQHGTIGHINDEATYNKVRDGIADWKPHIKSKLTHVEIPMTVFNRLVELDRQVILTVELSQNPLPESEDKE